MVGLVPHPLPRAGVLEATRIRREGYSWRPTFAEFVARYKILAFPVTMLGLVQENSFTAVRILEVRPCAHHGVSS